MTELLSVSCACEKRVSLVKAAVALVRGGTARS
jgi:hypothetical protein